ncbi:MAG: hypothetical protein RSA93_01655 [Longicatena sp.]
MNDLNSYSYFANNISTLKELSKDTSNMEHTQYMSDSMKPAINFDAVKTAYTNDFGLSEEVAKSVDALVMIKDKPVFIEFKNGVMKKKNANVQTKARDSLLIFCDITQQHINQLRTSLDFILVYNKIKNDTTNHHKDSSNSLRDIGKYWMDKAGEEEILFGLEKFKTLYFREVHTYNEEEFTKYLES